MLEINKMTFNINDLNMLLDEDNLSVDDIIQNLLELRNTIENLKNGAKKLPDSKDYKFLAQIVKLCGNILSVIPKYMLTIAMIPFFMDLLLFGKKNKSENSLLIKNQDFSENLDPVFKKVQNNLSFKGKINDNIAKAIGKAIDIEPIQEFAKKHSNNAQNIARDTSNLTDILLTGAFSINTIKSNKIEEDRKKPLIYNSIITTLISVLGGSAIDSLVKKGSKDFIEKFREANINNPKLSKYIEGINILRPTMIFAFIYYGLIPFFSVTMADKLDKSEKRFNLNKTA